MSKVTELFEQYKAAFEAGDRQAGLDLLQQLDEADRHLLELLVDDYLMHDAPSQPVDAQRLEEFRNSPVGQKIREIMAEPSPLDQYYEEDEEGELELTDAGRIYLLEGETKALRDHISDLEQRLHSHVQVHLALAKSLETAAEEIHKLKND